MTEPVDSAERWRLAAQWRAQFTAAARRQGATWADAEDAAAHAVEVVGTSDLTNKARLRGLGMTSAVNACRAQHRDRLQQTHRGLRAQGRLEEPDAAETVCDRAEAMWAATLAGELKPSWQRILTLRAAGLPVAEIARQLHLQTRAVEMQLLRARHALAAQVTATRSLILATLDAVRRTERTGSASRMRRGAAATATSIVVLALSPRVIGGATPSPVPTPSSPRHVNLLPTGPTTSSPGLDLLPTILTVPTALPTPALPPEWGGQAPAAAVPLIDAPGRQSPDETLPETVMRCLREGPRLSPQGVGCPP